MKELGEYQTRITSTLTTTNSIICDDETNIPSTTTIFNDNTSTALFPSLENTAGHDQSLHDIFQYLSEVPLHATLTPPSTRPDDHYLDLPTSPLSTRPDDHNLVVPTSKVNYIFQGCQNEGPEVNNLDVDQTHSKGKQHMEPGRLPIPHHQNSLRGPKIKHNKDLTKGHSKGKQVVDPDETHTSDHEYQLESLRRRSQKRTTENRRRQRVNEKLRAVQALIPYCDKAADHASILDQAIDYIRSLRLHIDVMSSAQSQLQTTYATQMMMQPRMFHGIESGPWVSQITPSGYPSMVQPVRYSCDGFPYQTVPQAQVQFKPVFCNPQFVTTPITTLPTPVVLPFAPSQPQCTQPTSSGQVSSFQPPVTR